jgi:hypothetical protein
LLKVVLLKAAQQQAEQAAKQQAEQAAKQQAEQIHRQVHSNRNTG